ncbi:MAG TPA: nucleoside hydrolase [Gammaproteobacteria bacterium]|nr:nucleoside hydrolase [Gammaproteobacteria bacterium]
MAAHRAVVLTTDVGADMDDQWALAHLVLSPDVDVRAVVTTHTGQYPVLAPPAAESSARIARDVLGHLPPREAAPPVIAGSSVALSSRAPLDNAGVQRIVSESRTFTADHRLVVLVIGAATDTASALLVDRGLHERIEIVAMGFNTCADGGDVFNVRNDPIAWQVILDSDVPVTIGDSSVTKRDLAMTSERAHALLEPAGDSGRYLAQLLDEWLATRKGLVEQLMGDAKSWPVWDEVTVAHLLGMTTVEHRTRPMLGADLAFSARPSSATISCVTAIDAPHLWSDLAQRLRTASAAGARR